MRSDMVLTSDVNFPFVTRTPFSMCFAVDVKTIHSRRILSFFLLFEFDEPDNQIFLFIFFEDERPATANTAHFGLLLF